jgi:UDP-N-acetylglucosamine 2-epimerase
MYKIMTIVGTRPELIKMSCVIKKFDINTNHVLVHTGQNYDYELNQIFFDDLGIRKPDYFLNTGLETPAATIGKVISETDIVIKKEQPDAILLYGDTNSCLSVISAKRNKIPIFHMEAGNRSFDQRVPEEINRKIVDHLSDINFVLTEHARNYLTAEGIKPETIIKTGSHMFEVLEENKNKIKKSNILKTLGLKKNKFFVVSAHREENIESNENILNLFSSLEEIIQKYNFEIIVSTHPRTMKKIENLKIKELNPKIKFLKPFGFFDYIKLQQEAYCVISDSGTITEEASLLNLKAITIRDAHERPEGMDNGTLIMCGLKKEEVLNAIHITTSDEKHRPNPIQDYISFSTSTKILKSVLSYINYINRTVWYKNL